MILLRFHDGNPLVIQSALKSALLATEGGLDIAGGLLEWIYCSAHVVHNIFLLLDGHTASTDVHALITTYVNCHPLAHTLPKANSVSKILEFSAGLRTQSSSFVFPSGISSVTRAHTSIQTFFLVLAREFHSLQA